MATSLARSCRTALSLSLLLSSACAPPVVTPRDDGSAGIDAAREAAVEAADSQPDSPPMADGAARCTMDSECAGGLSRCDRASGRCVACTDNAHCVAGMRCVEFVCQPSCGAGPACMGDSVQCCSDACVQTQTSAEHCGSCGNRCAAGQVCQSGRCVAESPCARCTAAQMCCSDACVDLQSDNSNCGACGNRCLSGQSCRAGVCVGCGPCPAGNTCCSGVCRNLVTDVMSCGMCGASCAAGQTCVLGRCQ
jgi:hypothetical protein